jgi:hypothetical protein
MKKVATTKKAASILKKSTNPKLKSASGLMRDLSPFPSSQGGIFIGESMDHQLNLQDFDASTQGSRSRQQRVQINNG